MSTYREVAYDRLSRILEEGSYANIALKAGSGLSPQDRERVTALVYETLDRLFYLDHILNFYAYRSCKRGVRNLLRLGICELLYMRAPSYAVIHEYVSLARALGFSSASGFVNAILRNVDRNRDSLPPLPDDPEERLRIRYSCPDWILKNWTAAYGPEMTEQILSAPKRPVQVRLQYPADREDPGTLLPVPFERGKLDPNALSLLEGADPLSIPAFRDGRITVQSEAAMLACRALGDPSGLDILDACAAPGGKSAYLYSLSRGTCRLTCMELHPHRAELMRNTFRRLGVEAEILCRDASVPVPEFASRFDRVLLDAPCSGLGLFRSKPDVRYAKQQSDLPALASLQRSLLDVCSGYVSPGGILVYCTCTISRQENEENIRWFLSGHPDFQPDPVPIPLENSGMIQLLPGLHGTDGFFIARLHRCI